MVPVEVLPVELVKVTVESDFVKVPVSVESEEFESTVDHLRNVYLLSSIIS